MLFIVFTDRYDYLNIFGKFNANKFTEFGNHVLVINKDLNTYLLNECLESYSENINYADIAAIFINDIDIRDEELILDILENVTKEHKEILTLYHQNGHWTTQREIVKNVTANCMYSEYFDSRLPDSIYFNEIYELADAVSTNETGKFHDVLEKVKVNYIKNEFNKLHQQLFHPDILKTLDNIQINSFVKEHLISEKRWHELVDKIKDTYKKEKNNFPERLNQLINYYLRIN